VENLPNTTYDKVEVNLAIENVHFALPAALKASAQKPDAPKDAPKNEAPKK
jgi:hypothetical protein